jgi:hypothetical protein
MGDLKAQSAERLARVGAGLAVTAQLQGVNQPCGHANSAQKQPPMLQSPKDPGPDIEPAPETCAKQSSGQ